VTESMSSKVRIVKIKYTNGTWGYLSHEGCTCDNWEHAYFFSSDEYGCLDRQAREISEIYPHVEKVRIMAVTLTAEMVWAD